MLVDQRHELAAGRPRQDGGDDHDDPVLAVARDRGGEIANGVLDPAVVEVDPLVGQPGDAFVELFVRRLDGDEDDLGVADDLVERAEAQRALAEERLEGGLAVRADLLMREDVFLHPARIDVVAHDVMASDRHRVRGGHSQLSEPDESDSHPSPSSSTTRTTARRGISRRLATHCSGSNIGFQASLSQV